MPFTLVHPAAVLPLARSPLLPSALVAGAVAPDLPYYVPLTWLGGDYNLTLTHSATSLLWLDPVVALVLLGVLHLVLRRPLVALAPVSLAGRLPAAPDPPRWRGPVVAGWVVVSVVLGAATHLAWDAFGDAFGYGRSGLVNLAGDVVGAAVLAGWLWRWWRRTTPRPVPASGALTTRQRALVLGAMAVVVVGWTVARGVVTAARVGDDLRTYGGYSLSAVGEYVVRGAAVDVVVGLAVALVAYAAGWFLLRRRSGARPSSSR